MLLFALFGWLLVTRPINVKSQKYSLVDIFFVENVYFCFVFPTHLSLLYDDILSECRGHIVFLSRCDGTRDADPLLQFEDFPPGSEGLEDSFINLRANGDLPVK